MPAAHDMIAFTRIKDWIKLLGFDLERGRFGCYRPPLVSEQWLQRYQFMEAAGDRWWPIFGAAYMITAIKRVRGHAPDRPAQAEETRPRAGPRPGRHSAHTQRALMTSDSAQKVIDIYTDGACKGNPGPGGWGALLRFGARKRNCSAARPPPPTTAWN